MERTFSFFPAAWLQHAQTISLALFPGLSPNCAIRGGHRKSLFCTKSKLSVENHLYSATDKVMGHGGGTRLLDSEH